MPGDLDLGKEETAEEILPAIVEPEAFEVPDTISKLSKELREIFTYFVPITGMEEQLCQALTGASQHLTKWNDSRNWKYDHTGRFRKR